MRIEDPEIRKMLADRGCTVEGDRVKFTDELIDATVKNQKSKVTMTTRNGYAVNFELGKTFSHSTGGAPFISDALTGKRREAKMSDLIDTIKVMNQCDNLIVGVEDISAASLVRQCVQVLERLINEME